MLELIDLNVLLVALDAVLDALYVWWTDWPIPASNLVSVTAEG